LAVEITEIAVFTFPFPYDDIFCHDFLLLSRLGRLQDSNAVLTHFNEYSEQCFVEVSSDFASKTRLLKSMKSDLDHIFTKLRWLLIYQFSKLSLLFIFLMIFMC
jgi:hypothetical protein